MADTSTWPLALAVIFSLVVLLYILSLRDPKITTVVVGPLFLYLVAGIIGAAQLYFMGTLILSLCVVSYLFACLSLRGVDVTRSATTPVTHGDPVEVRVEVTNRDWLPKLFLRVRCPLPEWLRAEGDTFAIPGLWPGQSLVSRIEARACKRGCYVLAPVEVLGADPLDLFRTRARRAAPAEVIVRPVADAAPSVDLLGDEFLGVVSPRRVVRPGYGLDFHGLRDYRSGDDLRTIDWKATARMSRLIAVEYEPTQVGDLAVLLDNREGAQVGTGERSTLERAISLAAGALSAILEARGTALLRYLENGRTTEISGRSGDEGSFLDALARVEPSSGSLADLAMDDLRGRTVLVVTPDAGADAAGLVRLIAESGGRPVALLLDAPAFAYEEGEAVPLSPRAQPPRLLRILLEFLGLARDVGSSHGQAAGHASPPIVGLVDAGHGGAAVLGTGALRDAGAEVVVVGRESVARERLVRDG